jgi:predicted nuclease with TOPRIM domain
MTATTAKICCTICRKEKITYKCEGCLKNFCFDDLTSHRQLLIKQLDNVEYQRNIFRQILFEQSNHLEKHSLIQQIDRWEKDSIIKIQQTANEAKQLLLKHTSEHINQIEMKLSKLTEELKQIREENDVNEIHLYRFKQKLKELEEQLHKPSNISIQQEDSFGFVNKIIVLISSSKSVRNTYFNFLFLL